MSNKNKPCQSRKEKKSNEIVKKKQKCKINCSFFNYFY